MLTDEPSSLTRAFDENTYTQETLDPWLSIKGPVSWSGEIVQGLRTLAALTEDSSLIP